jgi:hypothetical protein
MKSYTIKQEWLKQVAIATDMTEDALNALVIAWLNQGKSIRHIETDLVALGHQNNKQIMFVKRDCN